MNRMCLHSNNNSEDSCVSIHQTVCLAQKTDLDFSMSKQM